MMIISSTTNAKVKTVRRLQNERRFRLREKAYVAEGTRWVSELIQMNVAPTRIFHTERWLETAVHAQILQQIRALSQTPPIVVTEAVMQAMSDTNTAPGILVVLPIQPQPIPEQPTFILVLDGINTPGNLGTMLRTAGAAGIDLVLLTPNCVDVYNPKVVRGGMGAHLRLPIHHLSWEEIEVAVQDTAVTVATIDAKTTYTEFNWQSPATIIIGSEAHGASQEARTLAQTPITIPMHKATESLNAAMAAGIILFEAARQRRQTINNKQSTINT